jgi:hypothetical protein
MTIQREELGDGRVELVLDAAEVSSITLTTQITIGIRDASGDALTITISTPFCVGNAEADLSEPLDPEKDDVRLGGVILRLRHRILTRCLVEPTGTLHLAFDDGFVIVVGPDQRYEAWDIDHRKFKIVGAAGGELATWDR